MAKKKTENFILKYSPYLILILTFIVGWFSHLLYTSYDRHINRPILSFKIQAATVSEFLGGQTILKVILFQENIGDSEAMYTIEDCVAYFPLVSNKQMKIKVKKYLSLDRRTNRCDTIKIPLTFDFEESNIVKREANEVLMKGGISNGGPAKYRQNVWVGIIDKSNNRIDTLDPNLAQFLIHDPKNPSSGWIVRGNHLIFYKGIYFMNFYYPNTAKVTHRIENDKIYIECALKLDPTGKHTPGFYFIPNEKIKDYIVLPKYYSITASVGDSTDVGMIYQNLRMDVENNDYGVILYFLFKE